MIHSYLYSWYLYSYIQAFQPYYFIYIAWIDYTVERSCPSVILCWYSYYSPAMLFFFNLFLTNNCICATIKNYTFIILLHLASSIHQGFSHFVSVWSIQWLGPLRSIFLVPFLFFSLKLADNTSDIYVYVLKQTLTNPQVSMGATYAQNGLCGEHIFQGSQQLAYYRA